jgi:hypothetical protein
MMKLGTCCTTFLIGFALTLACLYATGEVFRIVSQDGHSGTDAGGAQYGYGSTEWESSSGIRISEGVTHYSSAENARKALETYLASGVIVTERRKNPGKFSGVDERVVVIDTLEPEASEVVLFKVRNNQIYSYRGGALQAVEAFDNSWFKISW